MTKFVMHENNSEQQYWILRLEIEGVLRSWVLPKNPLIENLRERIANQVKERPLEYLEHEGEMSEGNYGLGESTILDSGEFNLISNSKSKIEFELLGEKFNGEYYLKKVDYGLYPEKSWLLFKVRKEEIKREDSEGD